MQLSSMVKKASKKGGKKKEIVTDPAELKHFDVRVNDIIRTPLGVLATVIGMEKESGVRTLLHRPPFCTAPRICRSCPESPVSASLRTHPDRHDQVLWLKWPSDIESPMPPKCQSKAEMEAFGYVRESQSAHIQRSLDHRTEKLYQHKFCGGLMPKTAELKLPAPKGVEVEWAPGTTGRPKSAPKAKAS